MEGNSEGCLIPETFATLIEIGLLPLESNNNWYHFLTQGIYDPRLLLLIGNFLRGEEENFLIPIYRRGFTFLFPLEDFMRILNFIKNPVPSLYYYFRKICLREEEFELQVRYGNVEMIDFLLSQIMDVHLTGFKFFKMYYLLAIKYHREDLISFLLEKRKIPFFQKWHTKKEDHLSLLDLRVCFSSFEELYRGMEGVLRFGFRSEEVFQFFTLLYKSNYYRHWKYTNLQWSEQILKYTTLEEKERWYQLWTKYIPVDKLMNLWETHLIYCYWIDFFSYQGYLGLKLFFSYFSIRHPLWKKIDIPMDNIELYAFFLEQGTEQFDPNIFNYPAQLEILLRTKAIHKEECLKSMIEHNQEDLINLFQSLFPPSLQRKYLS